MAGAAVLERLTPRVPVTWRVATVRAVVDETPTARTLVLDVPGWPGHVAGQHVDVRLTAEDGYQAQRSYSIASGPEDPGLAITVQVVPGGEVSPYLAGEARPGDELELRGPIGGFFAWRVADGGPLLLVGGGSGLAPLMAMLRHRRAQASTVEARLLASVRGPADALYRAELDALGPREGLRVAWTYTRERPAGWTGFTGRVDAGMLAAVAPPPEAAPRCFVCGPTPFVETVADLLVRAGHDPRAVHAERFGPTGS
ncbi:MAG: ferredoxin reductase [Solirubrobacteraceae bacterium]|nr:ferredoxin reductase [Solirubrobacteraceae bacterium]